MKNSITLLLSLLLLLNPLAYCTPPTPTWTNTNSGTTYNTRPFLKFTTGVPGSGVINDARVYCATTGWDWYYRSYLGCFKGIDGTAGSKVVTFRPSAAEVMTRGTSYTFQVWTYESTNETLALRTSPGSAIITVTCGNVPWSTDPSLAAGTYIKAAHFNELKAGIDLLRTFRGSGGGTWTNLPAATGNTQTVKAVDLNQLRANLGDANQADIASPYCKATGSNPTYTAPNPMTATTGIAAVHVTELRAKGLIP